MSQTYMDTLSTMTSTQMHQVTDAKLYITKYPEESFEEILASVYHLAKCGESSYVPGYVMVPSAETILKLENLGYVLYFHPCAPHLEKMTW